MVVHQEISEAGSPPAERVDGSTDVIFVPNINISTGIRYGGYGNAQPVRGGSGSGFGGSKGSSGGASSGKEAAIAIVVIAAVALVAVAAVEGSRYDGTVQLHPMHPVHLWGRDGGYTVVPIAWLDASLAAWAEKGVVRSTEGPWRELQRQPLWRQGLTYAMYGGTGSMESVAGDKAAGPAFLIQGGYFPTDEIGILASMFFGWRDNRYQETMFDSRYFLELDYYPIKAGALHAGLFGGIGAAYRFEDLPDGTFAGGGARMFTGGALFQLELHTRIALTGRLGITHTYNERTSDMLVGISVY